MSEVLIVDCGSGDEQLRPLTTEEQAQRDADAAETGQQEQARGIAQANRSTIEDQARTALANNRTFLGKSSPSNADVIAQVKALTRQSNGLIRLVLNQLDATD